MEIFVLSFISFLSGLALLEFLRKKRFIKELRENILKSTPVSELIAFHPDSSCREGPSDVKGAPTETDCANLHIPLSAFIREYIASFENVNPALSTSVSHSFLNTGKMLRSRLAFNLSQALGAELNYNLLACAEMEHTASLIHDDIVDSSNLRRGLPSYCSLFGNRIAALHGDFVVAALVIKLANVSHHSVTELFSASMLDLVKGEFLQLGVSVHVKNTRKDEMIQKLLQEYLIKSFLKTASLFVVSCESVALIHKPAMRNPMRELGTNIGLCFQIVDDILDLRDEKSTLKPSGGFDLLSGHATAPVIYAAEEDPCLIPLIARRFSEHSDVEYALRSLRGSSGLRKAEVLADQYASAALEIVERLFEPSIARNALQSLIRSITSRKS